MSARNEPRACFLRYVSLDLQCAAIMKDSRTVKRFLDTHTKIDDIGQKMYVTKGLIVTSHYSERHDDATATGKHAGHQCVHRPLSRCQCIRMDWLQSEAGPAIL